MRKQRQKQHYPASIRFKPEREFELRMDAKKRGLPFSTYLKNLIEKAYEISDVA